MEQIDQMTKFPVQTYEVRYLLSTHYPNSWSKQLRNSELVYCMKQLLEECETQIEDGSQQVGGKALSEETRERQDFLGKELENQEPVSSSNNKVRYKEPLEVNNKCTHREKEIPELHQQH